ncbi:unnamed protein product [Spirodela intermedia]|uniref:C2H2-type domain-containing protein n=2 Tax=Spirodela intermedia TaxID=51605 RepID=A0A7I8K5W2_SPIIN|nr:unnamed protein product [Spirodela intermedia]CAA6656831.1 unnamed protein product [Spirodela intermedia]CAA7392777.1 unnamed protein product [Spirodela intermedia]
MKRARTEEEGEEGTAVANVLMLLSTGEEAHRPRNNGRLFGCKTCNRQFASFQALGGHRASHKKPRLPGERLAQAGKPRVHGCPICGLEFSMGQALGGHMRRHRAAAESFAQRYAEKKPGADKCADSLCLDLDLNTFPSEKEVELHPVNLSLGLAMVDCLY